MQYEHQEKVVHVEEAGNLSPDWKFYDLNPSMDKRKTGQHFQYVEFHEYSFIGYDILLTYLS